MAEQPSERERFEAWAVTILGDNPMWRESAPCELAWQAWQARASLSQPSTEQGWTHEINQELERQYLKGFQAGKAFEREQCALVCDRYGEMMFGGAIGAQKCAAAIRSRKDAP